MIELRPEFRNAIAGLCAAFTLGCQTARSVNLVENPDATSRPSRIEIATNAGLTFTVYRPVVRQDSLRGYSDAELKSHISLALTDIESAAVRRFDGGRTALLVFGFIGVGLALATAAAVYALSEIDW